MSDQQLRTQHCTTCGHAIRQGDAFCTECGTSVSGEPRKPLFADEVPASQAYVSDHRAAEAPATPPAAPRAASPAPSTAVAEADPEPEQKPAHRRRGGLLLLLLLVLLLVGGGIALGSHLGLGSAGSPLAAGSDHPGRGGVGAGSPSSAGAPSDPGESGGTGAPMQPQDQLHLIAQRDDHQVRGMTGRWVPQLAALTPGAGGDDSWSQALTHFNQLRRAYPDALLLDTAQWPHSYETGGMYAVVLPVPHKNYPAVLSWCRSHGHQPPDDCAAKQLATSGSWADRFQF